MTKDTTKEILQVVMLVILTSSIYFAVPTESRFDIRRTYSTYSEHIDGRWTELAREFTAMWDGTARMRAFSRDIDQYEEGLYGYAIRTANFKDGCTVENRYKFDLTENATIFPIEHNITAYNCQGFILEYEVTGLFYEGETERGIEPPVFYDRVGVTWDTNNYYSRIWGYARRDEGKLTVRWRPDSDEFAVSARLREPSRSIMHEAYRDVGDNTTMIGWTVEGFSLLQNDNYECTEHVNPTNNTIICDSRIDGNGDGVCTSGESCQKFVISDGELERYERNSADEWLKNDPSYFLERLEFR